MDCEVEPRYHIRCCDPWTLPFVVCTVLYAVIVHYYCNITELLFVYVSHFSFCCADVAG